MPGCPIIAPSSSKFSLEFPDSQRENRTTLMWILKRWEHQTTLPASRETCTQVKKQQLEPYMEQRTVKNWAKSTSRLHIVTLLI